MKGCQFRLMKCNSSPIGCGLQTKRRAEFADMPLTGAVLFAPFLVTTAQFRREIVSMCFTFTVSKQF